MLLSEYIKNRKRRNICIVLMLPVGHSSYVFHNIIRSSVYIAIMIPSDLKTAIGGFVSFVNFLGPEDNSFGSTENFKSLDSAKTLGYFVCFNISIE